jgi:hypothetical protein
LEPAARVGTIYILPKLCQQQNVSIGSFATGSIETVLCQADFLVKLVGFFITSKGWEEKAPVFYSFLLASVL